MPFVLLNSAWQKQSQWVGERFGTLESEFVRINAGMNDLGAREGNACFLRIVRIQLAIEEGMDYGPMPLFLHSAVREKTNSAGEAALYQTLEEVMFWKLRQKTPPKPAPVKGTSQTSTAFIGDDGEVLPCQEGQQLLAERHDMPQVNQIGLESVNFPLHLRQIAHIIVDFTQENESNPNAVGEAVRRQAVRKAHLTGCPV